MGFEIDNAKLKRAGLDYWHELDITYYKDTADFFEKHKDISFWLCSTKSDRCYADVSFKDGDYLFFGKETKGLPETLLKDNLDKCIRIPMRETARSLNLANSVNIILYEALRQTGFDGLMQTSDYLK